jgi:hypothetical protein
MTVAYSRALKGVNFEKEGQWYLAIQEHQKVINESLENDLNRAHVCFARAYFFKCIP